MTYDPESPGRMASQPCSCCGQDSIRAFRVADGLCLRCYERPDVPHFIPTGRGLKEHMCDPRWNSAAKEA